MISTRTTRSWLILPYLLACIALSAYALQSFAGIVREYLAVEYHSFTEVLFVTGQVAFQWMFMTGTPWRQKRAYAVIALTVSAIGSVLLIPLIVFDGFHPVSPILGVLYFGGVVLVIFIIHHLLILRSALPPLLSLTWILYRTLLLVYLVVPRL